VANTKKEKCRYQRITGNQSVVIKKDTTTWFMGTGIRGLMRGIATLPPR